MDKSRKKMYLHSFRVFHLIVLTGLFLLYINIWGIYGLIIPLLLILFAIWRYKREKGIIQSGLPEYDERYEKAKGKGAQFTLFCVMMALVLLFMYTDIHEDQGIWPELPLKTVLMLTMFGSICTLMASVWYFDRRGN